MEDECHTVLTTGMLTVFLLISRISHDYLFCKGEYSYCFCSVCFLRLAFSQLIMRIVEVIGFLSVIDLLASNNRMTCCSLLFNFPRVELSMKQTQINEQGYIKKKKAEHNVTCTYLCRCLYTFGSSLFLLSFPFCLFLLCNRLLHNRSTHILMPLAGLKCDQRI